MTNLQILEYILFEELYRKEEVLTRIDKLCSPYTTLVLEHLITSDSNTVLIHSLTHRTASSYSCFHPVLRWKEALLFSRGYNTGNIDRNLEEDIFQNYQVATFFRKTLHNKMDFWKNNNFHGTFEDAIR